MAASKEERIKQTAMNQVETHTIDPMFSNMTPVQDQEPATDQEEETPKKKRGRPSKKTAAAADPTPQEATEATKKTTAKKTPTTQKEAGTEADMKPKTGKKSEHKGVFSAYVDDQISADIKRYCRISGQKLTDVTEAAFREYMQKYPLTAEQISEYKQREMERINSL